MKLHNPRTFSYQTGFTLVEIMVGLAIGMLATVIIMQVFSVFEAQKRTTTGSGDAQTNGNIALHSISSDLRQAGYGIMPGAESLQKCTALTIDGVADMTAPNRLTPVAITDGVSDSLTIRTGDTQFGGITMPILPPMLVAGTTVTVDDNFFCPLPGRAVAIDGLNCDMETVVAVSADGVTPSTVTLSNAVVGTHLVCLGIWSEVTYTVNNASTKDASLVRGGTPFMANIVNLQAQYGISAIANSNQITGWVDATGAWAAPSTLNRNRIKAIRIAIVARNPKMETGIVTNAVSAWGGAAAIDLSADANWQHYRYRVFESIIPLRNVIWAVSTLP